MSDRLLYSHEIMQRQDTPTRGGPVPLPGEYVNRCVDHHRGELQEFVNDATHVIGFASAVIGILGAALGGRR